MKKTLIICILILSMFQAAFARPDKVCGVYVSIWTMHYPVRFLKIVDESVKNNLNSMVCDFNGADAGYVKNFKYAKQKGLYLIGRIVVFDEGVGANYASAEDSSNWNKKLELVKQAENLGFDEVQLDYIRFADAGGADIRKKEIVEKFLREAKAKVSIPVGADVFGSVAYQPHHLIGQDLNRMADIIDVVSPMLYPSHFLRDAKRMAQPYETMLEGSTLAKQKIGTRPVRMIPYIQAFSMNMSYSKLSLKDYIKAQIRAVEDGGTDGLYFWNAANDYSTTWLALQEHGALYATKPKSYTEVKAALSVTTDILGADLNKPVSSNGSLDVLSLLTFGVL